MDQTLKTKTRMSTYHLMHGLSRGLRGIGWFITCLTLGSAVPNAISTYTRHANSDWTSDRALELTGGTIIPVLFLGLFFAACAFLLSAMLYAGLLLMLQRRTQIALLERLVRERHEKPSSSQTILLLENL